MGISGLLPFVKEASKNIHISELRGRTVAIDSYCWLHRGVIGCAEKVIKGEDTDVYVQYCFKFIDMLLAHKITPIMVFDGQNLAAKAGTEVKRRENRAQAKKRAVECMKLNKTSEARKNFIQAVDINPKMALKLIQACRARKIDCIVAPYEADAQLAYLNLNGFVDFIISEDSDLLVFGCKKVVFKLDTFGNGLLVESEKLFIPMKEKPDNFKLDIFRHMCILSGCDYLDSLPGIGLKKALKFIKTVSNQNISDALPKIPRILNLKNIVVTKEYIENFLVADATFRHQLVFDPMKRILKYLTDPDENGTDRKYLCNAGEMMDNDVAFQLAIGNRSPHNLEVLDNWNPDKDSSLHTFRISIWSKKYQIPKKSDLIVPKSEKTNFTSTQGKNVVLSTSKVLHANVTENINTVITFNDKLTKEEYTVEEKIKNEMEKMYFSSEEDEPSSKRICLNSSQKENSEEVVSPVLSRSFTVNKFAKKHFYCDDDSDDDFQTDKRKGNNRPNLKRIRKVKMSLKEDKNESTSLPSSIDNQGSPALKNSIKEKKESNLVVKKETDDPDDDFKTNKEIKSKDIKKDIKNKKLESEINDIKTNKTDSKIDIKIKDDPIKNIITDDNKIENDLVNIKTDNCEENETKNDLLVDANIKNETDIKNMSQEDEIASSNDKEENEDDVNSSLLSPPSVKDSQESLTNRISNCRIIEKTENESSTSSLQVFKFSNSQPNFTVTQKETVQVKSTQVITKQIARGVCRRPGLSRRTSKTIVPNNQTTLSHFFKTT